ncbi:MAG: TlyA family RNA methyltransferase [Clostridia bacterium]|nr:TlyA family RNA methyltransferase [Clostridia bacterium]
MKRLDNELLEKGLFKTKSKAQQAIKSGIIYCNGKQITKCGYEVNEQTKIEIKGEVLKYVSRGGLKLEKALRTWNIDLTNKIMIDIGSSTGGFSDCAIQNGIEKIYAIDVGTEQFDKILAQNPKINLYEQTDFRTIDEEIIKDAMLITIDVSFISVTKLIEKISKLENVKEIICLIKPQFECGKEIADKFKGVILDKEVHNEVIKNVTNSFENIGYSCEGVTISPIKGGDGNTEYLAYLKK